MEKKEKEENYSARSFEGSQTEQEPACVTIVVVQPETALSFGPLMFFSPPLPLLVTRHSSLKRGTAAVFFVGAQGFLCILILIVIYIVSPFFHVLFFSPSGSVGRSVFFKFCRFVF